MRTSKRLRPKSAGRGPRVEERDGVPVIRLGEANIWDGGDLIRIREAAAQIFRQGTTRIGVDLAHVGVLPSGFVHMLCGWQEGGREVYLFAPRPNVREMFWFRRFTEPVADDTWRMTCAPPQAIWPESDRTTGRPSDAQRVAPACDSATLAPDPST